MHSGWSHYLAAKDGFVLLLSVSDGTHGKNVVSLYIALTVPEDGCGQGARRLPWRSVDAVRGDSDNGVQRLQL